MPRCRSAPEGGDCRSEFCDDVHNICIELCGADLPACGDGFSCISIGNGVTACTLPRDDGCSVGGRGNGLALLLMIGAALILARKRRGDLFKTS